jgi:hypothetical protein
VRSPIAIRREQWAAFGRGSEDRFLRGVENRLRVHWPDLFKVRARPSPRAWVEAGLAQARLHGVTDATDVVDYIDARLLCGDDFASQDWARGILADPHGTSASKALRLNEVVERMVEAGQVDPVITPVP